MVATSASVQENSCEEANHLLAQLERHAADGDWHRVQVIAAKLCDVVMQVPEAERLEILQLARRSTENVQSIAGLAHREVTEKLTALHRGRDAARAYGSSTGVIHSNSTPPASL